MKRGRFDLLVFACAAAMAAGAAGMRRVLAGLPDFQTLEEYTPSLTTRVYDVNEELIAELSIEKRALLTLSQIPVDMQNAVLATEVSRFFQDWGISPRSIGRAAIKNFLARRVVEGASTLTQQLSKLIFLTPERKFMRKI